MSISGSKGMTYLEEVQKPFLRCIADSRFHGSLESLQGNDSAPAVLPVFLELGEVIEVLEGPHKETQREVQRVHVQAFKDRVQGWLTLDTQSGPVSVAKDRLYYKASCVCSLADAADGSSKVIRQINGGEWLAELAEHKESSVSSLAALPPNDTTSCVKIKVEALQDGKVGWTSITTMGEPKELLQVSRKTALQSKYLNKSANDCTVRLLEAGELLEVLRTKTQHVQLCRVKVRRTCNGEVGWIEWFREEAFLAVNFKPWFGNLGAMRSKGKIDNASVTR